MEAGEEELISKGETRMGGQRPYCPSAMGMGEIARKKMKREEGDGSWKFTMVHGNLSICYYCIYQLSKCHFYFCVCKFNTLRFITGYMLDSVEIIK